MEISEHIGVFLLDGIFVGYFWGSRVSTLSKYEKIQASLVESRQKEAGSSQLPKMKSMF